MNNYYSPYFYRIDFVVIPFYIERPWTDAMPWKMYFMVSVFRCIFIFLSVFTIFMLTSVFSSNICFTPPPVTSWTAWSLIFVEPLRRLITLKPSINHFGTVKINDEKSVPQLLFKLIFFHVRTSEKIWLVTPFFLHTHND